MLLIIDQIDPKKPTKKSTKTRGIQLVLDMDLWMRFLWETTLRREVAAWMGSRTPML